MVTKKQSVKTAAPRKTKKTTRSTKASKTTVMQSFRVAPNVRPFLSFKLTIQTLYWSVFMVAILLLQLWILKQQLEIMTVIQDIAI